MSTTINGAAGFDTVPNHVALTVSASWRHGLNRTFEAVECQGLARLRDLKGLVVVVAADIANCHVTLPFSDRIDFHRSFRPPSLFGRNAIPSRWFPGPVKFLGLAIAASKMRPFPPLHFRHIVIFLNSICPIALV